MPGKVTNVLFLCTGNSARSIMAEAVLDRAGGGRLKGHSAGSDPAGAVNPHALAVLQRHGYPTGHLRSKSWQAFAGPHAPVMDIVITVCDNAAAEACPVWPGQPVAAHWPFADPARFEGPEAETRAVFGETYDQILGRIETFVSLPLDSLDQTSLQFRLRDLGQRPPAGAARAQNSEA